MVRFSNYKLWNRATKLISYKQLSIRHDKGDDDDGDYYYSIVIVVVVVVVVLF